MFAPRHHCRQHQRASPGWNRARAARADGQRTSCARAEEDQLTHKTLRSSSWDRQKALGTRAVQSGNCRALRGTQLCTRDAGCRPWQAVPACWAAGHSSTQRLLLERSLEELRATCHRARAWGSCLRLSSLPELPSASSSPPFPSPPSEAGEHPQHGSPVPPRRAGWLCRWAAGRAPQPASPWAIASPTHQRARTSCTKHRARSCLRLILLF